MVRKILHLDLDAFFCAVEEQRDPTLRGKPFAVGGRPDQRGVVASCSYPARQYGIHSAMPMAQAIRRYPPLIIVPSRHGAYGDVSRLVMARLHQLTPLVEQLSIDEAFLDVSDLSEPATHIAQRLQKQINTELELPCSLGVAANKLVAKIANNIGKSTARRGQPPNAIKIIPPGQEANFLAPLPVKELWGVGPKTEDRLSQLGISTIGALAKYPDDTLARLFGKLGRDLSLRAKGIDDRPVTPEHEAKSISQETTFAKDISDGEYLRHTLRELSEQVGQRLRKKKLRGTTVKLKLRWADFVTLSRQLTRPQPIHRDDEVYAAALELFEQTWLPGKKVRLIGVGVSGFNQPAYQLGLWDAVENEPAEQLQSTLDELRNRFGKSALQRGSQLEPDSDD